MTDPLVSKRPARADAARNFDAIVAAAREVFERSGSQSSMDEIARIAGVGSATLYRHFPRRDDLVEALYAREVALVCEYAESVTGEGDPFEALTLWLRRLIVAMGTKRLLMEGLAFEPSRYPTLIEALYAAGRVVLEPAKEAGAVASDLEADDVMRLAIAVSAAVYRDDAQRERVFAAALRGLRPAN
ncbi:TetR/AcrR family transcriptional regulator [Mycetocola lacteus]|nr:TetR/AcrR family transcriptional regulator [Mycetocola lacteus]